MSRPSVPPARLPAASSRRGAASARRGTGERVTGRVLAVAAMAAAAVLVGHAAAFWLCVPLALIACGLCRTPPGALAATATVLAGAAVPLLALSMRPAPQPALAVLVPVASALVFLGARGGLERERDKLLSVALTDPLTGVANRRSLLARAEYEIARHVREDRSFTVVMVDLDGFKALNDRFGHDAGDELLCDVAAALLQVVRGQDTVARLGGDEFCVLAPGTDVSGVEPLAGRIKRAVAQASAGVETLRASVGTAVFPEDGRAVAQLMQVADQRLLAAKRERPGGHARRQAA